MRLIPLWEADEQRAYDLQMSFRPEENGFINSAYGLSRQAFSGYVQLRKRNSQAWTCQKAMFPIPSMCWRTTRGIMWALSTCATV